MLSLLDNIGNLWYNEIKRWRCVMAYTTVNYRTKKSLVQDVKAGKRVTVYQPGPFGPDVKDGICHLEGPHYPEAHKWYASAIVKAGVIISIKS